MNGDARVTSPPARTEWLFGLPFIADCSIDQIAVGLLGGEYSDRNRWTFTVTPNVDHVVRYHRFPRERNVGRSAQLVLPDGMPIVWASRLLGQRLQARLTGSDLFATLWPSLHPAGIGAVALVADAEVARRLQLSHPFAVCVVPPYFEVDDATETSRVVDSIVSAVVATSARFVLIGVAMPKHHRLAELLSQRELPNDVEYPHVLLLGASAEFFVGSRSRAPRWMQRSGLEWVHRVFEDPRRLAKRYLVDDVVFIRLVWNEWLAKRKKAVPGAQ